MCCTGLCKGSCPSPARKSGPNAVPVANVSKRRVFQLKDYLDIYLQWDILGPTEDMWAMDYLYYHIDYVSYGIISVLKFVWVKQTVSTLFNFDFNHFSTGINNRDG